MQQLILGSIFAILFLFSLLILEYFSRNTNINSEITRKIAHIESGLFGILMAKSLSANLFIFFLLLFQLIIIFSYKINFLKSIHNVKRKTFGEILLPLGILTAFAVSAGAGKIFFCSVLILTFADPLSGHFGNMKGLSSKIGQLLFFLFTFVAFYLFFPFVSVFIVAIAALALTFIEKFSPFGLDNLSIPLVASLILKYLF
jgi:phytol kinase